MTEHDTDTERDSDSSPAESDGDPPTADISPCYQAYLERHDHRPDSCTIYSAVTADAARNRWIKAWGDGFVSREDAR
ncbi:hypothetical protein G6M89_05430 [Natronolimnobius sp. AArcel1]|uniref:DUF7511 domain-containing protein n=1 Tax=Natronolimnobius sp. AArcel1 TaxID=1679093 RepID=UPI0013ED9B2B|nr:hypothetical protein [Natronolimnobius sp. AArcel1]